MPRCNSRGCTSIPGLLVSNVCASRCPGNEEDLRSKLQAAPHRWPLCPGTLWDMFNCVVCVTQRSSFHRDVEITAFAWHQNLRTLHCLFYIRLQYNLLHNTHKSRGFQICHSQERKFLGLKLHRQVLIQLLTITPAEPFISIAVKSLCKAGFLMHSFYTENQALGDSGEQCSLFHFFINLKYFSLSSLGIKAIQF